MKVVHAAAVLSLAGAAACLFPDLGSLGDGGVDATGPDAPPDAPSSDAPSADAAGDAGPCSGQHVFCDDFDDGPLGANWDSKYLTDGGALGLTTVHATSTPNALAATVAQTGPGIEGEAELQKNLPAADHTRVQADVTIAAGTSQNELDFIALLPKPPPPGFDYADLNLQLSKSTGYLEEYVHGADGGGGQDLAVTETYATTKHVVLDLDFPSQTYALAIDGVPIVTMTLSPQIPKCALQLEVGDAYIEGSVGTWTVFVDDVIVDQW